MRHDAERELPQPPLLLGSRAECREALRAAIAAAADAQCRELWFCDPDYADWPLGERATIECMTRWARPHRRLVVLALGFETLIERHPRWIEWRRRWSHLVECRVLDALEPGRVPSLLLASDVLCLRVLDPETGRARVSADPIEAMRCRETIDALMQRSVEGAPVTALGL